MEKEGVSHLNIMGGTHATASREFLLPNAFNAKHTKGNADFVALGRSQLADPAWAKKAKEGRASDIKPCINCLIGCIDRGMLSHTPIHCTVNPSLYRFECKPVEKAETRKQVAVVGAGPARSYCFKTRTSGYNL